MLDVRVLEIGQRFLVSFQQGHVLRCGRSQFCFFSFTIQSFFRIQFRAAAWRIRQLNLVFAFGHRFFDRAARTQVIRNRGYFLFVAACQTTKQFKQFNELAAMIQRDPQKFDEMIFCIWAPMSGSIFFKSIGCRFPGNLICCSYFQAPVVMELFRMTSPMASGGINDELFGFSCPVSHLSIAMYAADMEAGVQQAKGLSPASSAPPFGRPALAQVEPCWFSSHCPEK